MVSCRGFGVFCSDYLGCLVVYMLFVLLGDCWLVAFCLFVLT